MIAAVGRRALGMGWQTPAPADETPTLAKKAPSLPLQAPVQSLVAAAEAWKVPVPTLFSLDLESKRASHAAFFGNGGAGSAGVETKRDNAGVFFTCPVLEKRHAWRFLRQQWACVRRGRRKLRFHKREERLGNHFSRRARRAGRAPWT